MFKQGGKTPLQRCIFALVLVVSAIVARAQGTILFQDFTKENVKYVGRGGGDVSSRFAISLYLDGSDVPLATTGFLDGTAFIQPPINPVVVPGFPVNSFASFVVRVHELGKTYETSAGDLRGQSAAFIAGPLGGSNGPGLPATTSPDISMMPMIIFPVPEPSTCALALLGIGVIGTLKRGKKTFTSESKTWVSLNLNLMKKSSVSHIGCLNRDDWFHRRHGFHQASG